MAKISHSGDAPKEQVHYTFAGGEFELGGRKKTYETEDLDLIQSAEGHPWLTVERTADAGATVGTFAPTLAAEDDAFSFVNDKSNDPKVAKAAEKAKASDDYNPTPDTTPSDEKDKD